MIQCRLDYFLISNNLIDYTANTDIFPGIRTDHSAVCITIKLSKDPIRGPGHWKFNNSYLEDAGYVQGLHDNLKVWLDDPNIEDCQVKWEWIKYKTRDWSINYAKKKCKARRDRSSDLNNTSVGKTACY